MNLRQKLGYDPPKPFPWIDIFEVTRCYQDHQLTYPGGLTPSEVDFIHGHIQRFTQSYFNHEEVRRLVSPGLAREFIQKLEEIEEDRSNRPVVYYYSGM